MERSPGTVACGYGHVLAGVLEASGGRSHQIGARGDVGQRVVTTRIRRCRAAAVGNRGPGYCVACRVGDAATYAPRKWSERERSTGTGACGYGHVLTGVLEASGGRSHQIGARGDVGQRVVTTRIRRCRAAAVGNRGPGYCVAYRVGDAATDRPRSRLRAQRVPDLNTDYTVPIIA